MLTHGVGRVVARSVCVGLRGMGGRGGGVEEDSERGRRGRGFVRALIVHIN
jgi:hypothetical protein